VPSVDSPYPLGAPVTDPRLLQNRRAEIAAVLDAVAPAEGSDVHHAAVLGEQRSGRSTVLLEVGRRAAAERGRLVVWLRTGESMAWLRRELIRHLLTATVEAIADAASAASAAWYQAWRDRVYLRDRSPANDRDLLSSALMLAVDPEAEIDRPVVERDLAALLTLVGEAGLRGIVLCMEDASVLTEDVVLVEEILSTVDAVGGYSLLISGLPATAQHFREAASPCLSRLMPVWLHPFRGPHQIFTSLRAPLAGAERDWIRADDAAFLRDVLRLTGGNPHELMLVGHHLWLTCQRGEQESYALTPRVLDRLIPHLSVLTSGGDALLDGAEAIDRLAEEHVRQAVELVALSRLTVRQIAIARILKVNSRDADRVDRAILTADIGEETRRVLAEVQELQEAGVIQLHADRERFSVVGGRPASVLLKYKARARIGAEVSSQPFEQDFLVAVGAALARDATVRTIEDLDGSGSLGYSAIVSSDGAGRLSPRPAIRKLAMSDGIARLAQTEMDLVPWGAPEYRRIAELLTDDDPSVALVYTAVTHGRQQLEYTELWDLAGGVKHEDVAAAWSAIAEEWQPVVAAADLNWNGSEFAVLRGDIARQTLIVLHRYAATSAVHSLFDRWHKTRDQDALRRAQEVADEAVATMRASGLSESELAGELSGMLSRVGFLKSFDDKQLAEARTALEDALRTGDADDWVTNWNLANVAARQGDVATALAQLDAVAAAAADWESYAFVLVFIPGRDARESLVRLSDVGMAALLQLQRALVAVSDGEAPELRELVDDCVATGDPGAMEAARWAADLLGVTA
jgi:hypothetical protein